MCGRYKMVADFERLKKKFSLADLTWDEYMDQHGYKMRPEVYPGTPILAINNRHQPEDIWWTIRDKTFQGKTVDTINAKAETVAKVPMFRDAFRTDRVLIPATGLYEWQTQPDGSKLKYEIRFEEPIFAFAGIARECEIKGEPRRCGVILTTRPNRIFAEIHNSKQRQAVVVRERDYEKWLDPRTPQPELSDMMYPLPEEETHFELAG